MIDKKQITPYHEMFHLLAPSSRFNILSLDPYVAEGRVALPYRYFPGPVATRFFLELRDHQRIMGLRCITCGITYVPPESTCGKCFEKLEKWVEVGNQGDLECSAVTYYSLSCHPRPAPIMYGLIRLDGADTCLIHVLDEVESHTPAVGMRMEAVFKKERRGDILDIQYFRPVQ